MRFARFVERLAVRFWRSGEKFDLCASGELGERGPHGLAGGDDLRRDRDRPGEAHQGRHRQD